MFSGENQLYFHLVFGTSVSTLPQFSPALSFSLPATIPICQLAEAVRLADRLLFECALKAQMAVHVRAQQLAAQTNGSGSGNNGLGLSSSSLSLMGGGGNSVGMGMSPSALFASPSGAALLSPLSPQSTRSLSESGANGGGGGMDDDHRSVSGLSMASNFLLQEASAAAAAGNIAGAAAATAAAAAAARAAEDAMNALVPPAPPSVRLAALLQECCAHLMTAAHAAEVAHADHFDFGGGSGTVTLLRHASGSGLETEGNTTAKYILSSVFIFHDSFSLHI